MNETIFFKEIYNGKIWYLLAFRKHSEYLWQLFNRINIFTLSCCLQCIINIYVSYLGMHWNLTYVKNLFFILLNKHGLNPWVHVHVNIEQVNKFWDKDILGHTLVWFCYNFTCVNPIFFCQYCINFETHTYRDMLKKKEIQDW